ncbi:MAG TPA: DUF4097 family beta strand repeat-containing protein [Vicinamibacterales bacterium]|nr:DUF4097 family beta strand repeat-containing protein [Vicinamibacterales bacterium]
MKLPIRLTFALVALLLVAPPGLRAASADTERVDRTIPFQPGGSLTLKNFSGRVTITATDRPQVVVHAVRHGSRDQLDRIKLVITTSPGDITIEADKKTESSWFHWGHDNVVRTDFDIEVPAKTDLRVHVFSSPVTISGVDGRLELKGFSSPLTVQDVSGPVHAGTFSGDIVVRSARWTPGESLEARTFSGDIHLQVPATLKAHVQFRTFSGDIRSDVPMRFDSQRHGETSAELGGGSAASGAATDFTLRTFSGSVHISR